MESVWTWDSIIEALGGTLVVAEALGEANSTVSGWRVRPRGIPGGRWSAIVKLASERGRADITLEVLAEVASRRHNPGLAEVRA